MIYLYLPATGISPQSPMIDQQWRKWGWWGIHWSTTVLQKLCKWTTLLITYFNSLSSASSELKLLKHMLR